MRRSFFGFQLVILAVALWQDQCHCQCSALSPNSVVHPSSTRKHVVTTRTRSLLPLKESLDDSLDNDSFEEAASQAILNGQGDLFTFPKIRGGDLSPTRALASIRQGYARRVAADPSFLSKSILEVILAALTQYMAEVSRRGKDRILPEIDFVLAGVLTAVCGKYYSMWRVARTIDAGTTDITTTGDNTNDDDTATTNWRDSVPTNAFQPTLLDGITQPTLPSRFMAFILPMPQLFRAGVIASTIGYGLTSFLIRMRTMFIPSYIPACEPISVPLAAIYTGLFMAFVSNVRYQILQGFLEPTIDAIFLKIEAMGNSKRLLGRLLKRMKYLRHLRKVVIVLVRWANGLLGSWIAIGGMRAFGLQKLKGQ